jgi:type VI protein secretion system component VasF
MADAEAVTPEPEPARFRQMSLPRQLSFWGFAGLVVVAVGFYVWWGVSFGVWIDNGVYAVVITLLLFGLAGMWLMLPNPPVPSPPATRP